MQSSTGSYNIEKTHFKRSDYFNIRGAHIYGIHSIHGGGIVIYCTYIMLLNNCCISLHSGTSDRTVLPLEIWCRHISMPHRQLHQIMHIQPITLPGGHLASTSLLIYPIWLAEIECTLLITFWVIVKFDVCSVKNWVRI